MNHERHLAKQNQILRDILGNAPGSADLGGRQTLKWFHNSDPEMFIQTREVDAAGQETWDYQCPCGWNATVHSANCLGAFNRTPRFIQKPIAPNLYNQFLLCRWTSFGDEMDWKRTFGNNAVYKGGGQYLFLFALDPNEVPTDDLTRMIGGMIREHDNMAKNGKLAEWLDAQEASRERVRKDRMMGIINDALPAYDHIPGKVGSGGISLPNPHKERKDNTLWEPPLHSTIIQP